VAKTVGRIKTKLGMPVGLGPGHVVLDGTPLPLSKIGTAPQFSAHICCHKMAAWIKMPLGRDVGLGPSDIVFDGDPAPPPQKGESQASAQATLCWMGIQLPSPKGEHSSPQFSAHVCCGQTAWWIKMPLGTMVCIGRATLCYMRTQLHPKGHSPHPQKLAHVCCGQTAGWIKMPLVRR